MPYKSKEAGACWYRAHKERIVQKAIAWNREHPERRRVTVLKSVLKRYGMTLEEYEDLVAFQNGTCWICEEPQPEGTRLHIDHDHVTGKVRGLLCMMCNLHFVPLIEKRGFGVERMQRALEYLKRPPFTS